MMQIAFKLLEQKLGSAPTREESVSDAPPSAEDDL